MPTLQEQLKELEKHLHKADITNATSTTVARARVFKVFPFIQAFIHATRQKVTSNDDIAYQSCKTEGALALIEAALFTETSNQETIVRAMQTLITTLQGIAYKKCIEDAITFQIMTKPVLLKEETIDRPTTVDESSFKAFLARREGGPMNNPITGPYDSRGKCIQDELFVLLDSFKSLMLPLKLTIDAALSCEIESDTDVSAPLIRRSNAKRIHPRPASPATPFAEAPPENEAKSCTDRFCHIL